LLPVNFSSIFLAYSRPRLEMLRIPTKSSTRCGGNRPPVPAQVVHAFQCEGFFGRLENEMFYGRSWTGVPIAQFIDELDSYLRWYNEKRIKMFLGAKSPKAYRQSIGLVA